MMKYELSYAIQMFLMLCAYLILTAELKAPIICNLGWVA